MKAPTLGVLSALITFVLCTVPAVEGSDECCRPIAKTIWYQQPIHDLTPQDEADVLRVDDQNGRPVLVIHTSKKARVRTSGSSEYHVARSDDGGKTLEPVTQDVPTPFLTKDSGFLEAPSHPSVLYRYVSELGFYVRSENGGLSWTIPTHLINGKTRESFALDLGGSTFDTVRFDIVAIDPVSPLTIFANLTVSPWTAVTFYYPDFKHTESIEDVKQPENTFVSHDGGETWKEFTSALRRGEALGISPSDPKVLYGHGRSGVVKSIDGGITWEPVGQQRELELRPLTRADKDEQTRLLKGPVDLRIRQILVDPVNENIVYLVSNKGLIRSVDGGATWCLLNLGVDQIDSARSIGVNPARPREIYVGTTRGVFFSSDRGCHFSKIYPAAGAS
ncbi:MAG: hypothetical protein DMG38_25055 [Acidobacteria bacterium]|nr:MAG: hypothetical protein DMG38_25055 [Acidobacteriota bacterium]